MDDHRQLHRVYSELAKGLPIEAYKHRPDIIRWHGYLPALARRHYFIVEEMTRRGWSCGTNHRTPIAGGDSPVGVVYPEPLMSELAQLEYLLDQGCRCKRIFCIENGVAKILTGKQYQQVVQ
jgi:hypothetical protein